jgi:hypothetical protein
MGPPVASVATEGQGQSGAGPMPRSSMKASLITGRVVKMRQSHAGAPPYGPRIFDFAYSTVKPPSSV